MRGTRVDCVDLIRCRGIIPAYAGNTCSSNGGTPIGQDHPRVCGEHTFFGQVKDTGAGSSPRMRGTQRVRLRRVRDRGIIPAYAGNTHYHAVVVVRSRDHPRVCGEHGSAMLPLLMRGGSSPRMRGTL